MSAAAVRERIELGTGLDAPRQARVLARELVGERLDGSRQSDLLVLVTELVTNAVRHAGLGPDDRIVLNLLAGNGVVRAEVCDPGPGFVPVDRPPGPDGGFGLPLLRMLSDRWGISSPGEPTCVWFELDAGREGVAFARELVERAGVVAIPTSVFYDSDAGRDLVRFAFCKRPEVIDEAVGRLLRAGAAIRV